MNIEQIDKWLKEEEGISYTELSKEFNDAVERFNKYAVEVKRLTKRLEESQLAYLQVDKDRQRLHTIINEFDKFLFGELQTYGGGGTTQEYYNKLQELKGSDKE